MNLPAIPRDLSPQPLTPPLQREWRAHLVLDCNRRNAKTQVTALRHQGPLRLLKTYWPEKQRPDACHLYLLHPPGGLVLGDALSIEVNLGPGARALLTTPSAGKVYGTFGAPERQCQQLALRLDAGSLAEWLPQETLVFNQANAVQQTHIALSAGARCIAWDRVIFGRKAGQHPFVDGFFEQHWSLSLDGVPLWRERWQLSPGSPLDSATIGLGGARVLALAVATLQSARTEREHWQAALDAIGPGFSLTQKGPLCLARYRGQDANACQTAWVWLWQTWREHMGEGPAIAPRIWAT